MTSPEELSIPGILVLGIGQALSEADSTASVTNLQSCFEALIFSAILKEKDCISTSTEYAIIGLLFLMHSLHCSSWSCRLHLARPSRHHGKF